MKTILLKLDTDEVGLVDSKEIEIFPRKCSISGKGMNTGYYVFESTYIEDTEEGDKALEKLMEEEGYKFLEYAFEDNAYYYTDWLDWQYVEGDTCYNKEGEEFKITFKC